MFLMYHEQNLVKGINVKPNYKLLITMRLKFILNLWMFLFLSTNLFSQKTAVKVACIGNSITYGAFIANRDQNSYPAQPQAYLGDGYEVRNYGVSGRNITDSYTLFLAGRIFDQCSINRESSMK